MFAMRRLRDSAAAEDVAQDTLKTVLEALRAGRIRDRSAIAGFAFETARNHCMHRGRSHSRQERAFGQLPNSPFSEAPDALTGLINEERRRAVNAALEQLDEDDRRLLLMTYVDGRDCESIVRELGISAGAIRVRRHRALKRLADLLRRNDQRGAGT